MANLILSVFIMVSGAAFAEELPLFNDPALLLDNAKWFVSQNQFREMGSETRAYLDLVTILYDWDLERPWGKAYVAQANQRLSRFREKLCPELTDLPICARPLMLTNATEVGHAQAALLDGATIVKLESRWNLAITPWFIPGQKPIFSLITALSRREETIRKQLWDLRAQTLNLSIYEDEVLPDVRNYRAGFESKNAPAVFAINPTGPAINDRFLKQRAVELAATWQRAIASNKIKTPEHILASATELQLQKIFEAHTAEFESTYKLLLKKVEGLPKIKERFLSERAQNGYPGEVYQHVAHNHLQELAKLQASYYQLAQNQRAHLSPRQKSLESMLTLQRYSSSPQTFAMEMMTLLEPVSSHASVLDQNTDNQLAMTYTLENLRAVLGLGFYEGKDIYKSHGLALANDVLFDNMDIESMAPEAAEILKTRKFADLKPQEQKEVLQAYLEPIPGRVRGQALLRLGTLFWLTASENSLKILAETLHERFYGANPVELTQAL